MKTMNLTEIRKTVDALVGMNDFNFIAKKVMARVDGELKTISSFSILTENGDIHKFENRDIVNVRDALRINWIGETDFGFEVDANGIYNVVHYITLETDPITGKMNVVFG